MMLSRAPFSTVLLSMSALALGSCAYAVDKSHQDISFVTPGAENAQCDVYVDKLRYQAFPPQTVNIMKSDEDMEVTCIAPGNRSQSVTVPAKFTKKAVWGTPVGMAWDYASQSLYYYPSVIAIDFSQEKTKPNPQPQHNSDDVDPPESHYLEEYLPGEPLLNSDKNKQTETLKRREEVMIEQKQIVETPINESPVNTKTDKGNLSSIIDRLNAEENMMTPMPDNAPALEDGISQPAQNPAGSEPVKLYPGE